MKTHREIPMILFVIVLFWAACIFGYIRNLYLVVVHVADIPAFEFAHLSGLLILRLVGIVVIPLGTILGFF
jgi:hypothetical protein